jgi:hydroxymethylbilane synthase
MSVLKLGTRKSLLAWAQSGWVAREIEKANPGTRVELVGIETRGDRVLDVSLQDLAKMSGGKEFFVAEIDDALRTGAVDLTVHSMKDLSLDRPEELVLAANPVRENPRDVALFGPGILEKLHSGKKIRIGTSSPRRLENLPNFLKRALPRFFQRETQLEFVEIRGNVNTRLGRVHEPESSPKHLDGVILAFAGLIRLWQDGAGQAELSKLLSGVRWMVLPLRECPAAPAQGALAIECRKGDETVYSKISKIHCSMTADHVAMERNLLAQWGGGCHQRFGATAISTSILKKLFYVRGAKPSGEFIEEFRWQAPPRPLLQDQAAGKLRPWDGSSWRAREDEGDQAVNPAGAVAALQSRDFSEQAVFVAHARALRGIDAEQFWSARVWTSGTASWFKLAEQGIWVEGCAENLGFETLRPTLAQGVLQLPQFQNWFVLTHGDAAGDWQSELSTDRVLATYKIQSAYSSVARESLRQATDIFWSSGSQFHALKNELSPEKQRSVRHACGAGKTASVIKERLERELGSDVSLRVFPSAEEWRKWIGISV